MQASIQFSAEIFKLLSLDEHGMPSGMSSELLNASSSWPTCARTPLGLRRKELKTERSKKDCTLTCNILLPTIQV
jgi:hypothetical protein